MRIKTRVFKGTDNWYKGIFVYSDTWYVESYNDLFPCPSWIVALQLALGEARDKYDSVG